MKRMKNSVLMIASIVCFSLLVAPQFAAAHCDTLDGPVIKDVRTALEKEKAALL